MISLLAKWFIKDNKNYHNAAVRSAYGTLTGIVGIGFNILLFALKYLAGTLTKSVSIAADAFNNLSDAGSSLITLCGFRLAQKKPDPQHPYGHGRFEYIAGLFVSVAILIMGYQLFRDSLDVILHGGETAFAQHFWLSIAILCVSILIKLYMFLYNRSIGKKIDSATMQANAFDSISDTVATSVVLISALITRFFVLPAWLQLDAWSGILVSLFIVYTGLRSAKDTMEPLLGQPPDPEYVQEIEQEVLSFEGISGVHDLMVHDYGPGRRILSLHAEVPADANILEMHDIVDNVEKHLMEKFDCVATIHMDPIATHDPKTLALHKQVLDVLQSIDPSLSMHDFRIVPGPTHTNLIFDVVTPFQFRVKDDALKQMIQKGVQALSPQYYCVIDIDRAYVK